MVPVCPFDWLFLNLQIPSPPSLERQQVVCFTFLTSFLQQPFFRLCLLCNRDVVPHRRFFFLGLPTTVIRTVPLQHISPPPRVDPPRNDHLLNPTFSISHL